MPLGVPTGPMVTSATYAGARNPAKSRIPHTGLHAAAHPLEDWGSGGREFKSPRPDQTQPFVSSFESTFSVVFTVFATAVDERGAFKTITGFGIGLVVAFDILAGGPHGSLHESGPLVRSCAGERFVVRRSRVFGSVLQSVGSSRRSSAIPDGEEAGRLSAGILLRTVNPAPRDSELPRG